MSHALAGLSILLLLTSCSRLDPVWVVNHRAHAVQVTYRHETYYPAQQRRILCGLKQERPRVMSGTDVADFRWDKVDEVVGEFDESRCEIRFLLPANSSALISINEICADGSEYFTRADIRPRLNFLRVESAAGTVELSGWEVSNSLVAHGGGLFSRRDCRFELR